MAKNTKFVVGIIIGVLLALLGWSLWNVLNQASIDLLANFGIEGFYTQNLVLVIGIFVILIILGFKFKKIIKQVLT